MRGIRTSLDGSVLGSERGGASTRLSVRVRGSASHVDVWVVCRHERHDAAALARLDAGAPVRVDGFLAPPTRAGEIVVHASSVALRLGGPSSREVRRPRDPQRSLQLPDAPVDAGDGWDGIGAFAEEGVPF